jgi:uncharacterized protein YeaO (DUF488 family)
VSKERAALDLWLKEVAPSVELRRSFGHDPVKWPEFQRRYREELRARSQEAAQLRKLAVEGPVIFVADGTDVVGNGIEAIHEANLPL